MRSFLFLLASMVPAHADVVLAARTLRPQTIVMAGDLVVKPGHIPGTYADPTPLVGQETRVAIYAGRPVRRGDLGPPALIDRNQIVPLTYQSYGLTIHAEGRSLSRAGAGDRVRVMNLDSHSTVSGTVQSDGSILVK